MILEPFCAIYHSMIAFGGGSANNKQRASVRYKPSPPRNSVQTGNLAGIDSAFSTGKSPSIDFMNSWKNTLYPGPLKCNPTTNECGAAGDHKVTYRQVGAFGGPGFEDSGLHPFLLILEASASLHLPGPILPILSWLPKCLRP